MSRYDRIPRLHPETSVSDPSTSFFAIAPQVARLRFHLPSPPPPAPMLVAVWNRPADLIRELYIGHETDVALDRGVGDDGEADLEDQHQWAWFPKRPVNAQQLAAEQRSHLLHVQLRPPEEALDLQAEDYQAERYRPEGLWRGRHLFLPRESHQTPLPPQALGVAYQPLRAGQEQRLVLGGLPQLRFLQPTLLYFNPSAKPQNFAVIIDGATQRRGAIAGQHGEIALPSIAAGAHRIQAQSPPATRWFISHAASGAPSHVKRLAYRLDAAGLSFIYERRQPVKETISMRWHSPYGAQQATHIYAHLELPLASRYTPSPNWTFHERRYVLAPAAGPPVPVLNTDAAYVDVGQPFFFPIGQDAPAGRYRIRLRLEQGAAGYLTLLKLNRGLFESRQFTGEKAPNYVQAQP